ncbi:MAG: FAD-dependent oxidoreductase [Acidobacteriota bacterium]
MKDRYDSIIVGAGPAGLFAANELASLGFDVLVIDRGGNVHDRGYVFNERGELRAEKLDIISGIGGAGIFSDGTLNLRPDIGGNLSEYTKDAEKAWDLVKYVDSIFLLHGAPGEVINPGTEEVEQLKRKAAANGASFIEIPQRHIGTDRAVEVISRFKKSLDERGVRFKLRCRVEDILSEGKVCAGVICEGGEKIFSKAVILAPGRAGSGWMEKISREFKIGARHGPIDVGIRVELPRIVMTPVTRINRDPKFHIRTKTYDDFVRTFCANDGGFVVKERYDDYVGVNGHSFKGRSSENTNFAFLVRVELTEPIENTSQYGRSVALLATTIGGRKPILQRLGDLRRGRRSNAGRILRNYVRPTLPDVTPGDISMALPHRIVEDLLEGLEVLDRIIPGVASDSTLLYAPEIKYYAMTIEVDSLMQTNLRGLFVAGDGAGLSRDLINASATGVIAGRGASSIIKGNA